jgi:hypothetical protein
MMTTALVAIICLLLAAVVGNPPPAAAVKAAALTGCASDMECSLNGRCVSAMCQCDAPWHGSDCGRLTTLPAQPGGLYNFQPQGYWSNGTAKTSSWGGNMLPAQNGWDLFVSEVPAGLANWGRQSTCVHATAPNRSGPFMRRGVALGAECHNTQVLRERGSDGDNGGYLLFHWPALDGQYWVARSATTAAGPYVRLRPEAPTVTTCNNPSPAYLPNVRGHAPLPVTFAAYAYLDMRTSPVQRAVVYGRHATAHTAWPRCCPVPKGHPLRGLQQRSADVPAARQGRTRARGLGAAAPEAAPGGLW